MHREWHFLRKMQHSIPNPVLMPISSYTNSEVYNMEKSIGLYRDGVSAAVTLIPMRAVIKKHNLKEKKRLNHTMGERSWM